MSKTSIVTKALPTIMSKTSDAKLMNARGVSIGTTGRVHEGAIGQMMAVAKANIQYRVKPPTPDATL